MELRLNPKIHLNKAITNSPNYLAIRDCLVLKSRQRERLGIQGKSNFSLKLLFFMVVAESMGAISGALCLQS
jgi:hypothetical protein